MARVIYLAVDYFFYFLWLLILVRVVISWFRNFDNPFVRIVYNLTEPLLAPIRNLLNRTPLGEAMVDLSPIVLFVLISIIKNILLGMIRGFNG
ncbi:MAG: YggT family protein [Clostridiales bacterium]|jgi:YggT family protein|nr:YggT family protein [Clostridiales bacterium]